MTVMKWRQLLSWEMKTTVISRIEDDCYLLTVISRNEDDCYLQGWRWLLSPGLKMTVISRKEDDCYIQGWRLLSPGMKTTVISRNEDDCYLQEWRQLLSEEMKMTVFFRDTVYIADFYSKIYRCLFSQGTRHAGLKLTVISFRLSSNIQCPCQTHDQRGTFWDWFPTQCPRHTHSDSVPPSHTFRRSVPAGHTLSCCIFEGNSDLSLTQGLWLVKSLISRDLIGSRVLLSIIVIIIVECPAVHIQTQCPRQTHHQISDRAPLGKEIPVECPRLVRSC